MLFDVCYFSGQFFPTAPFMNFGLDYFTEYLVKHMKKHKSIWFNSNYF